MVTARIDLAGLNKELNGFKNSFDSWTQQSVASAEAMREEHLKTLREFTTSIRNLTQLQKDLEKKALDIQQRLQNEQEEVKTLEAELSKVQEEQSKLPALIEEVQNALDAETREVQRKDKSVTAKEQSREKTVSGVTQALQLYEDRLGLKLTHNIGEELTIIFTQIDPNNPLKEFKASVRVLDDDSYRVCSCTPHVSNLQDLIDDLNGTNDFSVFVRSLRSSFKKIAS